jgi:hypothetical protein
MPLNLPHASLAAAITLAVLLSAAPGSARPGRWGGPGWGEPGWGEPFPGDRGRVTRDRSREGRVEVSRFRSQDPAAAALGHGPVSVSSQSDDKDFMGPTERAAFEAAVVDQLVHAGYDTTHANAEGGQSVELRITRTVIELAEARHKPVSGEAAISVGNRGTAYGLALDVDLSKPLPPLVETRLEARIHDTATGRVLWEGRAEVATREGDEHWTGQEVAHRLAEALFDGFPLTS